MSKQLQTIKLAFGGSASPNTLTADEFTNLIKVIDDETVTKEFSGYIKSDTAISAETYIKLQASNITYVGEVIKKIILSADKTEIFGSEPVRLTADVVPYAEGAVTFNLYNGDTKITPVDGVATYNGVSLDCATGAITTVECDANFTVRVTASADGYESEAKEILVKQIIVPTSVTVSGSEDIIATGDYEYTVVPVPTDSTVAVTELEITITELTS